MDANIAVLEIRATNGWRRYGKLAAIGAAALASAVAGLIVWRKSRLARSIVRGIAPAVAGTAARGLVERLARPETETE